MHAQLNVYSFVTYTFANSSLVSDLKWVYIVVKMLKARLDLSWDIADKTIHQLPNNLHEYVDFVFPSIVLHVVTSGTSIPNLMTRTRLFLYRTSPIPNLSAHNLSQVVCGRKNDV